MEMKVRNSAKVSIGSIMGESTTTMARATSKQRRSSRFAEDDTLYFKQNGRFIKEAFGENTAFGTLEYKTTETVGTFVRVEQDADPDKMIKTLMRLGYSLPRLAISITGGAQDFVISKELEKTLFSGLRKVVGMTDAWVICGGTNAGVMKYVGEAMADLNQAGGDHIVAPLIGVATWGVIRGRKELTSLQGGRAVYTHTKPVEGKQSACLDTNHTHQWLVDGHVEDKFGKEQDLRSRFEAAISNSEYLPLSTVHVRVPARFLQDSKLGKGSSQRTQEFKKQLAAALDTNDEKFKRLKEDNIYSLKFNDVALKSKRSQGSIFFKVIERDGVRTNVVSALKDFTFEYHGESFPICVPGEEPLTEAPRPEDERIDEEIFKGTSEIYALQLVVEGGTGTLESVKTAIAQRTPVLVIEGSGRIADVLAYAWRYLHDDQRAAQKFTRGQLMDLLMGVIPFKEKEPKSEEEKEKEIYNEEIRIYNERKGEYDKEINKIMQDVLEIVLQKEMVSVFSIGTGQDFEAAMLETLLNSIKPLSPTIAGQFEVAFSKLHLSVLFDQPARAKPYVTCLRELTSRAKKDKPILEGSRAEGTLKERYENLLSDGLFWSIINNHIDFVKIFLPELNDISKFLFEPDGSRLFQLHSLGSRPYFQALLSEGKYRSVIRKVANLTHLPLGPRSSSGTLSRASTERSYKDEFEDQSERANSANSGGSDLSEGEEKDQLSIDEFLERVDQLEHHLLFGKNAVAIESRHMRSYYANLQGNMSSTERSFVTFRELMVWAVFNGYGELSEIFWREGGHSIPSALYCSLLYSSLSKSQTVLRYDTERAAEMAAMSDKFEAHARGVLEKCYQESNEDARALLNERLLSFRLLCRGDANDPGQYPNSCELAHMAGNLSFFSHSAVQSPLLTDWYGGMTMGTSTPRILVNLIYPFSLLYNARGPFKITPSAAFRKKQTDDLGGRVVLKPHVLAWAHISAPVTKFYLDCISFVALLGIYSTVVVSERGLEVQTLEYVLLAWMSVLALEELRQVVSSGLYEWSQDGWNQLDFLLYGFFYVSTGLRLTAKTENDLAVAYVLYSINIIQLFFRALRLYAVHSVLGPKLLIIGAMMTDIVAFFALFIVFMLSYGVSLTALVSSSGLDWREALNGILYRPYFMVMGELFLEDLQEDTDCTGYLPFTGCSTGQWLVPVFTALYLLFVNIMLVNLLIAMMASTYEAVRENSLELWRFQFFELLEEYRDKPRLPPPLSIISLLWGATEYVVRLAVGATRECCAKKDRSMELVRSSRNRLSIYQEKNTDKYTDELDNINRDRDSEKLSRLEEDVSLMSIFMQEMHNQTLRLEKEQQVLTKRVRAMNPETRERTLSMAGLQSLQSVKSDDGSGSNYRQGIMSESMAKHTAVLSKETYMALERWDVDLADVSAKAGRGVGKWVKYESEGLKVAWYDDGHIKGVNWAVYQSEMGTLSGKSRKDSKLAFTAYNKEPTKAYDKIQDPKSKEDKKIKVPQLTAEKVPWSVDMPSYDPVEYTAPHIVLAAKSSPAPGPKYADEIQFNGKLADESFCGTIATFPDGLPRNPVGRTGVKGRGALGKWGPNRCIDQIITRWKRNQNGMPLIRENKPVLEFIAIKRRQDEEWALTGAIQRPKAALPVLERAFGVTADTKARSATLRRLERILIDDQVLVYEGYSDDHRNTDNAWMETQCYNIHDDTDVFSSAELMRGSAKDKTLPLEVAWTTAHRDIRLFASHKELVGRVCLIHGAYW